MALGADIESVVDLEFVVVSESFAQDDSSWGAFGQRFDLDSSEGPEFAVNTHTTSAQRSPSVAMDAAGNFVVVWESSFQDAGFSGIFGQRFRLGELDFFIGDDEENDRGRGQTTAPIERTGVRR